MSSTTRSTPVGYRVLDKADVPPLLADWPAIAQRLGGHASQWQVQDVADGNLNAVYLVDGPAGSVCVKQSLPYVRVAKDDWPLSVQRGYFESEYLRRTAPFAQGRAPALLHFDAQLLVQVMECLRPHTILRGALQRGERPDHAAHAVADHAASTLFHTSDITTPYERKFADVALFSGNHDLQRITLDLVFIDPYQEHPRNRYLQPHLNAWAEAIRHDATVKTAIAHWRNRYLSHPQALLHGDLHTGSVMVSPDDARVIDGEFAWVGPIGFDTGMFLANWVLAWFAHQGTDEDARSYQDWLQQQMQRFWDRFTTQFLAHWQAHAAGTGGEGDAYPRAHFAAGSAALQAIQTDYLHTLWQDSAGFLATEVMRRILGFAQVSDFNRQPDAAQRARQMAGALALARDVLRHPQRYARLDDLLQALPRFAEVGLTPPPTLHAKAVLLDIEGTVGDKRFVTEVLFPYARQHLPAYVHAHAQDPEVQALLQDTVALSERVDEDPVQTLLRWIDEDRKATPLKALQGRLWDIGFQRGEYRAHLYADAAAAIQQWPAQGVRVAIYSSGSVQAQQLYFGHSDAGDLRAHITAWFDTTTGPKQSRQSYADIARALQLDPADILFFSDHPAEVQAALDAGLQALHVRRPGTEAHPSLTSVEHWTGLDVLPPAPAAGDRT